MVDSERKDTEDLKKLEDVRRGEATLKEEEWREVVTTVTLWTLCVQGPEI